ncbi:MAG: GntR family transcriptional regulator [Pseudonocardia sp.]|nr:GntR family transcriptional regulator [Pseudonocardia sp.]
MSPRPTAARPMDRRSPLPLWAQLHAELERRLRAGEFDEDFPGEFELADEYKVSRHTVRDALRRLREDGTIDSGRGRGTWVRRPQIAQPIGALYSLYRSVEAAGLDQRSEVRALESRRQPEVAERLRRPDTAEFVYLERLRLADGDPLALDRAWLPLPYAAPLLEADFTHSGIYDELVTRTGRQPTGGTETITAVVPTAPERRLLKMPARTGALSVERLGCLDNEPVEWRESVIRGDRFNVIARWSTRDGYQVDMNGA